MSGFELFKDDYNPVDDEFKMILKLLIHKFVGPCSVILNQWVGIVMRRHIILHE